MARSPHQKSTAPSREKMVRPTGPGGQKIWMTLLHSRMGVQRPSMRWVDGQAAGVQVGRCVGWRGGPRPGGAKRASHQQNSPCRLLASHQMMRAHRQPHSMGPMKEKSTPRLVAWKV